MNWDQVWFPGRAMVRRRVLASCGPADRFAALGSRFGDWVELGREAPPAVVNEVEPYLAGYLDRAARTGRRWGALVGIVSGLGLAVVIMVVSWLGSVLS